MEEFPGAGPEQPAIGRPQSLRGASREDGVMVSERLLLNYLTDHPGAFRAVSQYLEPDDFSQGIYREIARMLFEQLQAGAVDIGRILSRFTEEEQQRECSLIFSSQLAGIEADQEDKAVRETIKKIVEASLRRKDESADAMDMKEMQKVLERRRKMDEIDRLNLS